MTREQQDLIKIGLVYSTVLLVLCGVITADWRGGAAFYLLGFYPYGAGLIFWPAVGYIAAGLAPAFGRVLCLGALAAVNLGVAHRIADDDAALSFVARAWAENRFGLMFFVAFYVGGQLVLACSLAADRSPPRCRSR